MFICSWRENVCCFTLDEVVFLLDKCYVMLCEWCCQSRMWLGRHRNFFCRRIIMCRIESFNFGSSSSDSRSGCLVITKEHYWNCLQIGRERLILLIKENGSWHGDYSPTSSRYHQTLHTFSSIGPSSMFQHFTFLHIFITPTGSIFIPSFSTAENPDHSLVTSSTV